MRAGRSLAILGLLVAMGMMVSAPALAAPPDPKAAVFPLAPTAVADKGLEVVWTTELLMAGDPALKDLWLTGRYLTACAGDNRAYNISAAIGIRLWARQMAEPFQKVWPPAVNKDDLWFATTTHLIGIKGADGTPLASIDLDFAPAGKPVTNGVYCYIPDTKGWLQAVALLREVVAWGRWTDDVVTAGPVLDGPNVYFADQSGYVYSSTQNTRHVQWQYKTEGAIVADLERTKSGLILAASLDYTLYAFNGASGRVAWRYNAGEPLRKTPYVVGNQVFVFAKEGGLAALDANGRPKQLSLLPSWTLQEGADLISADPRTVYVRARSGDLLAVNRADGKVNFSLPLKTGTLVAVNETENGMVYLALPTGQVMCVARKGLAEAKKAEPPPEAPKTDTPEPKKPAGPDVKKPEGAEPKKPEAPAAATPPAEAKPAETKPAEPAAAK